MASTENSEIPPPPSEPQLGTAPPASSLPQYSEMIIAAIEALDEEGGSNKSAISKQIEDTYGSLPAAHATLLSHHLNRMRQSGELALVKNNYMKPDPNAPPRRGRGRPPKPKTPLPPGTVVGPPRPRGRPPKEKDPFSPPTQPKPKNKAPSSGKPRGRPPKKAKTTAPPPPPPPVSAAADGGAPRGRGRPPKVKPALAPVVC